MDQQKTRKIVTAVLPAYNEGLRIAGALDVVGASPVFSQIIVVDDGSTDDTEHVVRRYPNVLYLKNTVNGGKGAAMERGVRHAIGDIIFFCDADIHGLTLSMIEAIVEPVRSGTVPMSVGMRDRKIRMFRRALTFLPVLGGERAVTRDLWDSIPREYRSSFRIETALNFYAQQYGPGFDSVFCEGLFQTIKEKKYGVWEGFSRRIRMITDIVQTQIRLRSETVPMTARTRIIALKRTDGEQ